MSLPFLIGITGEIGSGKDTTADFISHILGIPKYSFAAPMRQAASAMFGIPVEELSTQEGKAKMDEFWGMTRRDILRKVGNDATKPVFGEDFWIKRATKSLSDRYTIPDEPKFKAVVIPDVRFEHEAHWVRENGVLIHLRRADNPYSNQMSSHASDAGVTYKQGDFQVVNDCAKSLLFDKIFWVILNTRECRALLDQEHFKTLWVCE